MLKLFYLPPVQPGVFSCLLGDKKSGGLDVLKAAAFKFGHGDCLLNDGFFSFAVARQIL